MPETPGDVRETPNPWAAPPPATRRPRPLKTSNWIVGLVVLAVLLVGGAFVLGGHPDHGASAPDNQWTAAYAPQWPLPSGSEHIFTSTGQGSWRAGLVVLFGEGLSGIVTSDGDVDFRLVPYGAPGASPVSVVHLKAASKGTAWTASVPAGTYQLDVVTVSADRRWSMDLSQTRAPRFEIAAGSNQSGWAVYADGTGPGTAPAFTIPADQLTACTYQTQGAVSFYLVPEGATLNPARDLYCATRPGSGGAGHPAKPAGRYSLVVVGPGEWSLSLQSL